MKTKNGELRITVRYTRWYDCIVDFFKIFKKDNLDYFCKAGELRFNIWFDKKGKIISHFTPIRFEDGEISFVNDDIVDSGIM